MTKEQMEALKKVVDSEHWPAIRRPLYDMAGEHFAEALNADNADDCYAAVRGVSAILEIIEIVEGAKPKLEQLRLQAEAEEKLKKAIGDPEEPKPSPWGHTPGG